MATSRLGNRATVPKRCTSNDARTRTSTTLIKRTSSFVCTLQCGSSAQREILSSQHIDATSHVCGTEGSSNFRGTPHVWPRPPPSRRSHYSAKFDEVVSRRRRLRGACLAADTLRGSIEGIASMSRPPTSPLCLAVPDEDDYDRDAPDTLCA